MRNKPKYNCIELTPLADPNLEREYTMQEALQRLKELTQYQKIKSQKTTQHDNIRS
jgi:hypothetical protein